MTEPTRLVGSTHEDLAIYLRQIRRVPLLTASEERDLARRWRNDHCEEAREHLICANLRLAVYVAKRYSGLGLPLADVIEAANLGLLRAVDRFDPEMGARFATFALWWMKRSIANSLTEHAHIVRLPERQRRVRQTCRSAAEQLRAADGRKATAMEVAERTGLPMSVAMRAETGCMASVSGDCEDADAVSGLADQAAPQPGEGLARREVTHELRRCLHNLPEEEAEIVRMHFGIGRRRPLPIREIARTLDMRDSRVRSLLKAAISRLELMLRDRVALPGGQERAAPIAG